MQARRLLIATGVGLALALPALAQESLLPPGFGNTPAPAPAQPQASQPAAPSASRPAAAQPTAQAESAVVEFTEEQLAEMPPPVELPSHARRNPFEVGSINPANVGLTDNAWGSASGRFLSNLLRRSSGRSGLRWMHIALRNALAAETRAPFDVNPVDWAAERAWLLLRMGEADGGRMLVSGVDVDRFTPKMFQVGVQSALANSDPSALCPLEQGIARVEPGVYPLIQAMCAALAGEPESAASQIDSARRRGRIGGIDLVLAQKVVGAAADSGRAVTVEWEPVERLNAWRFGLATATGMVPPDRLLGNASLQLRSWQARSPMISPASRLDAAKIATGLGVFSSQAMVDLYALIYDSTDPDDLVDSDAWQLRQAFVGRDLDARLSAMRRLWGRSTEPLQRKAANAALARAATRIAPSADLQSDAPNLIASMLAGGYDREAARWLPVIDDMDDEYADSCWAMLALATPVAVPVNVSNSRIVGFINRDDSDGKKRSALLIGALTGLGRIDVETAGRLNGRFGLRLQRRSRWTEMVDGAAARGQGGTVAVLTGLGFETANASQIPAAHMFHAVAALRRTGQEFVARMIAAEALAPA
ncbi:MAG TPA: hypothetical protein VFK50_06235 [Sphingomicrobium sp.]|nr:hypothetical protein [Sphingomicrobium sp.]